MIIDKILIANRGEIACRIIRTAKRLGIATVAVYSDADDHALHVALADEAYYIGPAPATESYLNTERILQVALESGAGAIHPGYGFLAENARFAADCAASGVVFIGPPVKAIEAMGSKSAAKQIMNAAGIPLVPGYHEQDQSPERLRLAAESIGYPLLIKASAGGGGKGMRVVNAASDFDDALQGAKENRLRLSATTGCCWKNIFSVRGMWRSRCSPTRMTMLSTCLSATVRSSADTRR